MTTTVNFGYISFGGFKLFALPEDYQVTSIGNKSKPIPRANGTVLDIGYGYRGFVLKSYVQDASTIANMDNYVKNKVSTGTPITVTDTLYPGGKTWSGFFELPIVSSGVVNYTGALNLPNELMLNELQLTFYSIREEVL